MTNNQNLLNSFKTCRSKTLTQLCHSHQKYLNGNSEDAKKLWHEEIRKRKTRVKAEKINFEKVSDATSINSFLENTPYGSFKFVKDYEGKCSSPKCLWKLPASPEVCLDQSSLYFLKDFNSGRRERCPSCGGHFKYHNRLTVASPFLLVFGEGYSLGSYPENLELYAINNGEKKTINYKLDFVGLRNDGENKKTLLHLLYQVP
jgi:hypothetical protein